MMKIPNRQNNDENENKNKKIEFEIKNDVENGKGWKTNIIVPIWNQNKDGVRNYEDSINEPNLSRSFNYFVIDP